MGSINKLLNNTLYIDFRYRGKRCKEYTKLKDSPPNRRRLAKILERIEAEIILGTFDYAAYFLKSKRVAKFAQDLERVEIIQSGMPVDLHRSLTHFCIELLPHPRQANIL